MTSPSLQANVQVQATNNSYSLGLAYLHAVIENAGYDIHTENYNNVPIIEAEMLFQTMLKKISPDFLLIQVFTMNRVATYRLIKMARQLCPDMRIIVGGVHASIYPKQLIENFDIDCVVIGEGEVTIVELLSALSGGASLHCIKGIAYKKNGEIIRNDDRPLIEDIDSLPFPRHELFISPEREIACILTSRGCPFKCSFCCLHTISKRRFRMRSATNVADEVEYIIKKFPNIKVIQLADDTFTLDLMRAMEFCREIIRRNIKIKFQCSARIKPASVELFALMEKAGFVAIGFGLETGSSKLLKSIHKNITRDEVIKTFEMLKNFNIDIATYLMVGFPGENNETISETIDLIKRLQRIKYFEFAGVARLWVYPNTEVYDLFNTSGYINDGYWLTERDVPFFTLEHSEDELEQMVTRITLACQPFRQWAKQILSEFFHPVSAIKKIVPRFRRLSRYIHN